MTTFIENIPSLTVRKLLDFLNWLDVFIFGFIIGIQIVGIQRIGIQINGLEK